MKFKSFIMAVILVMQTIFINSVSYADSKNPRSFIVYENTFDRGITGLKAASVSGNVFENELVVFDGVEPSMTGLKTVSYTPEGSTKTNKAIRMQGAYGGLGQTFRFDFTKGGTVSERIKAGRVKLSFDFGFDTEASTPAAVRVGINMKKTVINSGGTLMYLAKTTKEDETKAYGSFIAKDIGGYPDLGLFEELDTSKGHSAEIVMDFDNHKVSYYYDGKAVIDEETGAVFTQDLNISDLQNIMIVMSGVLSYFDNLKIVYETDYDLECGINSEASEEHPGNNFFGQEKATVNLNVANRTEEDITNEAVSIKVFNSENTCVEEYTEYVSVGSFSEVDIPIELKLSEYDAYRIEVTSEKSKLSESRVARIVEVLEKNSKLGINEHFDGRASHNGIDMKTAFNFMKKAGIDSVRINAHWRITKKTDGTIVHDFPEYMDEAIENSKRTGVEILAILTPPSGAISLYDEATGKTEEYIPKDEDGGFNLSEESINAFYEFCRQTALKYGDDIKYFELGNEDNYIVKDDGTYETGENYSKLLLAGYRGVKAGNENVLVLNTGSGVIGGNNRNDFAHQLAEVIKNDKQNTYLDRWAVHSYHIIPPPEVREFPYNLNWPEKELVLRDDILASRGLENIKSWVTETGYKPGEDGYGESRTEDIMAARIVRLLALNEIYNLHEKIYLFEFYNTGFPNEDGEYNFGIMYNWDNQYSNQRMANAAKLQYLAVAQWNKMMSGAEFKSCENNHSEENGIDTYNAEFVKGNDVIHVVWDVYDNAGDLTIKNTCGKRYATVYDMRGNIIRQEINIEEIVVDAGKHPVYVEFSSKKKPEVMLYRDYEDYESGGVALNNTGTYGTFKAISLGLSWNKSEEAKSLDGKGIRIGDSITSVSSDGMSDLPHSITDGKVYISFDEIPNFEDGEIPADRAMAFNLATDESTDNLYAFAWRPGHSWFDANNCWSNEVFSHVQGSGEKHKIEAIVDMDNKQVTRYINGEKITSFEFDVKSLKDLRIGFHKNSIIDNLTVVYYPSDSEKQSFSMHPGEVDADFNTVSVFLKSDVESDGLKAPYGVTLSQNDVFTLFSEDGAEISVESVTSGKRSGEYIIKASEILDESKSYTVKVKSSTSDILEHTINEAFSSIVVKNDSEFKIKGFEISGNAATVAYKNTTAYDESFVVIVASYESTGALAEVVYDEITAFSKCGEESVSVSLNESVEGKIVKCFLVQSIKSLKPLVH